ncbi:MAG: stage III sporulation protein AE [Eubacteriales bacterium]|nr:stage III sporulation protein AE [Eubacteriales bacterium]
MRNWISLTLLCMLAVFVMELPVSASAEDEVLDSYMEELNLEEIQKSIEEMFPEMSFDFREAIGQLIRGEIPFKKEEIWNLFKTAAIQEVSSQKRIVAQIIVLAVAAAVFSNFVRVFEKNQISDIAFYMIYLMLFVILMKAFGELDSMARENLGHILHFMKLLLPSYLVVSSLAAGSVTAIAFYELTLFVITGTQFLMMYVVLPGIRFYVLFLLLNHLSREEHLSKLAELVKLALSWILKTMLALVVGIQTIQSLLLPAIDALKNSVWTKAVGAVPVLGNTLGTVTETVLGTAAVLKNAVGVAGLLVIVLLCLFPVARLAACTLLYKLAGAAVQPVSDRRITECISGVGEGAALLLKTVTITGVMFLITLAMVTASMRGL